MECKHETLPLTTTHTHTHTIPKTVYTAIPKIVMPQCAHAQARYTVVCLCICLSVYVCRLLQLLRDQ